MKFHEITHPKAKRVLGIDPSTKSVAWCLLDGDTVESAGDKTLHDGSLYERMQNAYTAAEGFLEMEPDYVVIESAVYVQNFKTVVKLAYFYGVIMGVFAHHGIVFDEVPPITWQAWIGNPPTKKKKRNAFKKKNPDLSNYKVKKHFREERKQITIDWVKEEYGYETDNDNIADAIAIAAYGQEVMTSG